VKIFTSSSRIKKGAMCISYSNLSCQLNKCLTITLAKTTNSAEHKLKLLQTCLDVEDASHCTINGVSWPRGIFDTSSGLVLPLATFSANLMPSAFGGSGIAPFEGSG